MPCNSGGYDDDRAFYQLGMRDAGRRLKKTEAMLCLLMRYIEQNGGAKFDPEMIEESGVTALDLNEWWDEHRRFDETRRAKERKIKQDAEARQKVLKKLTPDERKLLGV